MIVDSFSVGPDDGMCFLPLCNRAGEEVARVRVDPEDWFRYARYHWSLLNAGYAVGCFASGAYNAYRPAKPPADDQVLLHRLILGLEPGDPRFGDHVDGNKLDCRRSNLRILTPAQSAQNVSGVVTGSSRHRGVSWNGRRSQWEAYACPGRRKRHIGWFRDEDAAAEAARAWRAEHMPFSRDALEVAA
jgi:hypothetical protein